MTAHIRYWWQDAEPAEDVEEAENEWLAERQRRRVLDAHIDAAANEVQHANQAYELALKRVRLAPHGMTKFRRSELRTANARVLGAELRLAELRKQESP